MKKISTASSKKATKTSKKSHLKPKKISTSKKSQPIQESAVHNTSGAVMPNPAARNRPHRKDVRFAFR